MNEGSNNIPCEINDWLAAGFGYHQAGQLKEAEAAYKKILEIRKELTGRSGK